MNQARVAYIYANEDLRPITYKGLKTITQGGNMKGRHQHYSEEENRFLAAELAQNKNRSKSGRVRSKKIFGAFKAHFPDSTRTQKGLAFQIWRLSNKFANGRPVRAYRKRLAVSTATENDKSYRVAEAGLIAIEAKAYKLLDMVKEMRQLMK